MKATLRLHPSMDIPKIGMYAKHKNLMHKIIEITPTTVVIQKGNCTPIEVPIEKLDLYKLIAIHGDKYIGELAMSEYEHCTYNRTYNVRIVEKKLRCDLNTVVRVNKIPIMYLNIIQTTDLHNVIGRIVEVKNNTYKIDIGASALLSVKREFFVSLGSKDCHHIVYVN